MKEHNPAALYVLVKRIAHILKLPLTLHPSLAPELRRVKSRDPKNYKYDNIPPEVALMASMIIVLKMTYGLDGKPRYRRLQLSGHRLKYNLCHADTLTMQETRRWHFRRLTNGSQGSRSKTVLMRPRKMFYLALKMNCKRF